MRKRFILTLLIAGILFGSYAQVKRHKNLDTKAHAVGLNENSSVSTLLKSDNVYEQGFEDLIDFSVDFSPWTTNDKDNSDTYGFEENTFPNMYEIMAFIVFNPAGTTPSLAGDIDMQPHSGQRFAASFSATIPPSNDWLISPSIQLGDNSRVNMWVKSYTDTYGLERYRVGVSTTDDNPDNFLFITSTLTAPATAWNQVSFDLSDYDNQQIYLAINCVSDDAFIFMVDDIEIETVLPVLPEPFDLLAELNESDGTVTLTWDFEESAQNGAWKISGNPSDASKMLKQNPLAFNHFKVYRNGNFIATSNISEYENQLPEQGAYEYYVTAQYDNGESSPSNTELVNWGVGITEIDEAALVLFPNPAENYVYISSDYQVQKISAYNTLGKLVLFSFPSAKSTSVDLHHLNPGIYFLRIETDEGIAKRMLIKR